MKSLAIVAQCSFCSGSRSRGTNFATTHFMPRSCVKLLDTVIFGVPGSASSSHTVSCRSLLIVATCAFSILRCSACCRPSSMWITFNIFLTIFEVFVPHFYLRCIYCIIPKSFLNPLNSVHGGVFKLNAKFDADLLLYLLSHFECHGHTVHMLTQWCLPPPLTSAIKSSVIVHTCAFQSTLLGCQVTSISHKLFSLY